MADAQRRVDMTVEEFLEWNLLRDERYELVDDIPVPLRGMTGARAEHDTIVVNLIAELRNQLKGSPCRPRTAETAVRTKIRSVRRPDVTIGCAPIEPGSLEARNPVAGFEVLSPTTRQLDRSEELQEYINHPSMQTIVHIDPIIMDVMDYFRDERGNREAVRLGERDEIIGVQGLPVSLSLATIYDGVPLTFHDNDEDAVP